MSQPDALKVRLGIEEGVLGPVQTLEGGQRVDFRSAHFEVFRVVRLEQKFAMWLQDARQPLLELWERHQPTPVMLLFRPGIRAQQMQPRHAPGRQQPAHGVGAFQAQHAGVDEAGGGDLFRHLGHPARQAFDTQEIALGMLPGHGDEETAVAAAEVDFQGTQGIRENVLLPQLTEIVFGDEYGLGVGHGRIGGTHSPRKRRHQPPPAGRWFKTGTAQA